MQTEIRSYTATGPQVKSGERQFTLFIDTEDKRSFYFPFVKSELLSLYRQIEDVLEIYPKEIELV